MMKNYTKALIDCLPDSIILTDHLGHIELMNKKAAGLLGYTEATRGQKINFLELLVPEDRDRAKLDLQSALQKGRPVYNKYAVKKPKGQTFWASLNICPIIYDHKTAGLLLMIKHDAATVSYKQTGRISQYPAQFQKLVAGISAGFANLTAENLDQVINHALQASGEFFNLDRSYLFQFSADGKIMNNTHEWCAEGIEPQIDTLQDLPSGTFPWWMKKLRQFKCINVPSVEDMAPDAGAEKEILQAQSIQSVLVVPMISMNKLAGFIGFDSVREKRTWTEEQIALLKIVADIISSALAKHQAEEALRKALRQQYDIVKYLPDATFVIDCRGKVIAWNKAMEKMTGIPKDEMIGRDNYAYAVPFYGERRPILIDLALNPDSELARLKEKYDFIGGECDEFIAEAYAPLAYGGKGAYLWSSASRLHDASGNIAGAIESIRDITGRKRYEEQLKYLSLHDHLTGLYNWAFFEAEMLRLNNGREYPVTIISADVDNLKLINDTLGHDRGDELLKACATVLKQSLRKSDILARIGGDEFAAILPRTDEKTGAEIARRINLYTNLYNNQRTDLHLSISTGAATAETGEVSLVETLKKSDDLMYRKKFHHSARSQIVDTLLAALAERDYTAGGHARRLAELCLALGRKLGLSSRQLSDLALLAQVHDLGKVGIPDGILLKKGPLSKEEWDIMRRHPEKSYRIAVASPDLSGIAESILKHHERWDGNGYPMGLKGEEIPMECRVLAIADAFDAMTGDRLYRKAMSKEEAVKELKRCSGTQFDPELVDIFVSLLNSS